MCEIFCSKSGHISQFSGKFYGVVWASKSVRVFKDHSSGGKTNQNQVIVCFFRLIKGLTIKRFGETDCKC